MNSLKSEVSCCVNLNTDILSAPKWPMVSHELFSNELCCMNLTKLCNFKKRIKPHATEPLPLNLSAYGRPSHAALPQLHVFTLVFSSQPKWWNTVGIVLPLVFCHKSLLCAKHSVQSWREIGAGCNFLTAMEMSKLLVVSQFHVIRYKTIKYVNSLCTHCKQCAIKITIWHLLCIFRVYSEGSSCSPTQALVEALAYPGQDCQGYEVTKTGSNGCGYVVRVDARLLRTHNYTNHDNTWTWQKQGGALD